MRKFRGASLIGEERKALKVIGSSRDAFTYGDVRLSRAGADRERAGQMPQGSVRHHDERYAMLSCQHEGEGIEEPDASIFSTDSPAAVQ